MQGSLKICRPFGPYMRDAWMSAKDFVTRKFKNTSTCQKDRITLIPDHPVLPLLRSRCVPNGVRARKRVLKLIHRDPRVDSELQRGRHIIPLHSHPFVSTWLIKSVSRPLSVPRSKILSGGAFPLPARSTRYSSDPRNYQYLVALEVRIQYALLI